MSLFPCRYSIVVYGRVRRKDFSLICMTANIVHLYITSFWRYSIADLLGEIDFQRQRAFRHQRYPLADVLREHLPDNSGRNTLARVMFNWMPFDERLTFDTSSTMGRSLSLGGSVEGVSIVVYGSTKETLTIVFFGSKQAFDVERLQRYAERYLHILQKLIEYPPDKALASLALTTEDDLSSQLQAFNGKESPISDDRVSERFYTTAADYPDARALVCGDDTLTYRQLHGAASKLARYLIAQGIGPDDVVGICLERSTALIIAMLGVVHSGAAYLPLDPAQPETRLRGMLEDSRAKQLITQQAFCSYFAELDQPEKPEALALLILDELTTQERLAEFDASPILDSERTRRLLPGHLAYLIYTSGSTGKPKAVGVTQAAWSNFIVAESTVFGVTPEDRVLQFASMIFDASVWELSTSLTTGATVIMASSEERSDHKRLVRLLTTQKVSYALLPRAITNALSRQDLVPMRTLILAGEACPNELVARFSPGRQMFNAYGPTEATVYASVHGPLDPLADTQGESVPIGRPITNARIHILDAQLRPVPIGVRGELYIAGAGLARGYVGRSDLTAERFIACPFGSPGTRMYRSGDLARWREDGVLEFGGRADRQIKLRGFRVEPGEIEAALCAFESIDQATVLLREIAGEPRLVAYLIPTVGEGIPDNAYLREQLGKTLPDYMIPAAFVSLESWPLTTSGKVDHKALPDPEIVGVATFIAPVSTQEALLCRLFAELTGATRVSVEDSFFALGGHSLLAMRLVSAVREATHRELPLRTIFEQPTPRGLGALLTQAERKVLPPIVSGSGLDSLGHPTLSWGQERLWTLDQMDGGSSQYNMPLTLELLGPLDVTALLVAIRGLAIRHAALRTVIVTNDRGEPRGQLLSESDLDVLVSVEDLSDEPMSVVEARLATLDLANHRFDLSADALLYGQLLRLGPDRHMLALVVHHAAADGHSISVLLHEFFALYQGQTLPPLPYSYADHAFWQRSIQHERLSRDLTYWQAHLQGLPECLDLPLSYPRRADRARRAGYHTVSIPAPLGQALAERAAHEGITLFSLLLASWGLFLGRMARTEDVVVGTPVVWRRTWKV